MNSHFLTDADLEELTGYSRASDQCKALRDHGIVFVQRRDGKPRTTWFNVNHPKDVRMPANDSQPDFGALNGG